MGACCSCCFGGKDSASTYKSFNAGMPGGIGTARAPDTWQDQQARSLAAEKAAARQANFESSAVGRAAYNAVRDAKRPTQPAVDNGVTARDWQS